MIKVANKEIKRAEITRVMGRNYAEAFLKLLGQDSNGMGVDEIRERIKIMDKIEQVKTDSILKLEDSDAKKIKGIIDTTPWKIADREIIEMSDALKGV